MINRSMIKHLMEDLLCAGILLSLCAVIILGPQPKSGQLTTSTFAERAGTSADEESRLSTSLESIRHTSMKSANQ